MSSWMPTTPAMRAMWLALIILIVGYLVGQWLNRQRTRRAGMWIQKGLGVLGGRVAWRWSKTISAGAEAIVDEARAPYRNLIISYYLLTREFAPLWLWERLRGKHDLVAVRAQLRFPPSREFEIVPIAGSLRKRLDGTGGEAEADSLSTQPYVWQELSNRLGFGMRGRIDDVACQKAQAFLDTYGPHVERVSLRRRNPHMIAFFRLGAIQARPSADLWKALSELVKG